MNQSLLDLVQKRKNSREEALNRSTLPEELAQQLAGTAPAGHPAASVSGGGGSPFGRH
jgi:hypothetical protein